jgi:hypothetical protein
VGDPVQHGAAPTGPEPSQVEPAQEKIARLTRERDEMAAQAGACAEEVDALRLLLRRNGVRIGRERELLAETTRLLERARAAEAALAESERQRVEDNTEIVRLRSIILAARNAASAPWSGYSSYRVEVDDEELRNIRACADIIRHVSLTPTQETPDDQG